MPPKEKEVPHPLEQEGNLTLEQIEQKLVEIEAKRPFLERILNTGEHGRELKDIEEANRKVEAWHKLRANIVKTLLYKDKANKALLDLKTAIEEQKRDLDPEVQRGKLNAERLKIKLQEKQLQQQLDDLERSTKEIEDSMDLKNLDVLKEMPPPEDEVS